MRMRLRLGDSQADRRHPTPITGGRLMYSFYAWTPLFVVGIVALLALPWLGLIALFAFAVLALAAFAGLVWASVAVPIAAGRAIGRRWQSRSGAHRPSTTL